MEHGGTSVGIPPISVVPPATTRHISDEYLAEDPFLGQQMCHLEVEEDTSGPRLGLWLMGLPNSFDDRVAWPDEDPNTMQDGLDGLAIANQHLPLHNPPSSPVAPWSRSSITPKPLAPILAIWARDQVLGLEAIQALFTLLLGAVVTVPEGPDLPKTSTQTGISLSKSKVFGCWNVLRWTTFVYRHS